jgi:hypothetical protein
MAELKTRDKGNSGRSKRRTPLGYQSVNAPITQDDGDMGESEGTQEKRSIIVPRSY